MNPLLEVSGLSVSVEGTPIVNDLSFSLYPGQTLGVVGESGCGKTMTALSVMGLAPAGVGVAGSVRLAGEELIGAGESRLCELRGSKMSMIFQEPRAGLNPVMKVGRQVSEVLRLHAALSRKEAWERTVNLLGEVEFRNPERAALSFPHQLSGGECQRVMIAMAIACSPLVMIADEPTTALDVSIQAEVMNLIDRLVTQRQMALLWVSHDLGVVSRMCGSVMVMYGGQKVEEGPTQTVLPQSWHPYTKGLIRSAVEITAFRESKDREFAPPLRGAVPAIGMFPSGCPFRDRCDLASVECQTRPALSGREDSGHRVACWHPLGPEASQSKPLSEASQR